MLSLLLFGGGSPPESCLAPELGLSEFEVWDLRTTRWSTTISSKVVLPAAINFRAVPKDKMAPTSPQNRGERNPRRPPCGVGGSDLAVSSTDGVFERGASISIRTPN